VVRNADPSGRTVDAMSHRDEKERRRQARHAAELARLDAEARRTRRLWTGGIVATIGALALIVVLVASGGSSATGDAKPVDTRGLSQKFADNAKHANQVVDGSITDKLAELRGVPVVVNQWASWCPNCKQEFPFFQQLSQRYRGKVAFVGLDSQDNRSDAVSFLKDHPVDYPSIFDESAAQARSLGGGQGWPTTMFYNAQGQLTHLRPGGYVTQESLDADIRQFALGARS
jgi:thiol-disulfide isomerase/thioredoxin